MKLTKKRIVSSTVLTLTTVLAILFVCLGNNSYNVQEQTTNTEIKVTSGIVATLANASSVDEKSSFAIDVSTPVAGISRNLICDLNSLTVDQSSNYVTGSEFSGDVESDQEDVYTEEEEEEIIITATDPDDKYVNVSRYGVLNIRETPDTEAEIMSTLSVNSEVTIIGEVEDSEYVQVTLTQDDEEITGFVSENYLSDEKIELPTYSHYVSGRLLTPDMGILHDCYGFRLSYYNLDMSRCISIMRRLGYYDDVWVDQYGFKMMGPYIMAAGAYPKGTIVTCEEGDCIIVDHGGFEATYGQNALDLCTTW